MKKRRSLRASQRGLSLIEIMIVITIIAMVSAGVAVYAFKLYEDAKKRQAETDAGTVRQAVQTYIALESANACPSMIELVDGQVLDEGKNEQDPWGKDYLIACEGPRVWVKSLGPDGQEGTEDDIVVPRRRTRKGDEG
jgi:general secretion pathway protein G